jgi:hypothetical protein
MPAGPVNRTELEANYQNPGEIYDDTKTEGAFNVLADQIDANWTPLSNILGTSGSTFVGSPSIVGVTGAVVYDQLLSLKAQIDAIVSASIPPGSITTTMLQDESVTLSKLNADVLSYFAGFNPVSGSYTGNGSSPRTISLPYTPSAIFCIAKLPSGSTYAGANLGLAVTGVSGADGTLSITTNGFIVSALLNNSAIVYTYIAIR